MVIRLGFRFRVLDHPGVRKIHSLPIPRLGGVAIAVPTLVMVGAVCALDNDVGRRFQANGLELSAVVGGAMTLLLVGLMDDVRGLRARHKLLAQIGASLAVCAVGVRLDSISLSGIGTVEFGIWAWPLTVVWIVGMTNAMNLIDGLDGLAAGLAAIGCGVIAVLAITVGQTMMATLMLVCLGALVGFLVFNSNPASIFCGDSGTYFLGFLIGSSSLLTSTKSGALVGMTLPLLAMGIPIFDTLFAMLRRSLERRSLFAPDRNHIHHRLLALGLSQRQVVVLLYLVTIVVACCGMFMVIANGVGSVAIFLSLVLLLVGAFRSVGAIRLTETVERYRIKRHLVQQMNQEFEVFQDAELRMRESSSISAWWSSLCGVAGDFGFVQVSVDSVWRERSTAPLRWGRDDCPEHELVEFSLPINSHGSEISGRVRVAARANGSLESVGRRIALFGRLLESSAILAEDEESMPGFPSGSSQAFKPYDARSAERHA